MSWWCRPCSVQNSNREELCRSRGMHWSQLWAPGKQSRRSQSRKKKDKKDKASDKKEGQKKGEEDKTMAVFPSRVPWMTSTPQSRIPAPNLTESTREETGLSLPAEPVLPPPPAQPQSEPSQEADDSPLTAEEVKILEHYRGLKASVPLPTELQAHMDKLEKRERVKQISKGLTHGHLNRKHRLEAKLTSAIGKLKELDKEWASFVEGTTKRIKVHADLYQKCRGEAWQTYVSRKADLEALHQEMNAASMQMLDGKETEEEVKEEIDFGLQLAAMQSALSPEIPQPQDPPNSNPAFDGEVQEVMESDQEDMETELLPDGKQNKSKGSKPFVTSPSPLRVANQTLKPKVKHATT